MQPDRPLRSGFSSLLAGMDYQTHPLLLQDGRFALGMNISARGGLGKSRPGFTRLFTVGTGSYKGAGAYRLTTGDRIVCGIGDEIKICNLDQAVVEATHSASSFNGSSARWHFAQIYKFFVVQDGYPAASWDATAWPILLNGAVVYSQTSLRQQDPTAAFPKGSVMTWGQNRAFVAVDWIHTINGWVRVPRTSFLAGDILKAWQEEDILGFSESTSLDGLGAIALPQEVGFIRAMGFQRNVQSGTGFGPLVVFGDTGCATYAVDLPRQLTGDGQDWSNSQFGRILFMNGGTLAEWSLASVNNDLFYFGQDGLRTLRYSASTASSEGFSLSNRPISHELGILGQIAADRHLGLSGAYANNRYLFTAQPSETDARHWDALVSMDLSPQHQLGASSTPIYDGFWTGLRVLQVVSARILGSEKHFLLVDEGENRVGLWVVNEGVGLYPESSGIDQYEQTDGLVTVQTMSRVYSKAFNFELVGIWKRLGGIDLYFEDLAESVYVSAYYRVDGDSQWRLASHVHLSVDETIGRARKLRMPVGNVTFDCGAPGGSTAGEYFQLCIEWIGRAKLVAAIAHAEFLSEDEYLDGCQSEITIERTETDGWYDLALSDYEVQA